MLRVFPLSSAYRSIMRPINVQHLQPRGVQPLCDNRGDPLEQFVAEARVLVAFLAQAFSVERKRPRRLDRARVEAPFVRRDQPRPTQHIAGAQSQYRRRTASGREDFKRDPAIAYKVEMIGVFAFAKDHLPRLESRILRATGEKLNVARRQVAKERMLCQQWLKRFHQIPPSIANRPSRFREWPASLR